jgi:hypothetical protein
MSMNQAIAYALSEHDTASETIDTETSSALSANDALP